jgi:hypothetical protein
MKKISIFLIALFISVASFANTPATAIQKNILPTNFLYSEQIATTTNLSDYLKSIKSVYVQIDIYYGGEWRDANGTFLGWVFAVYVDGQYVGWIGVSAAV